MRGRECFLAAAPEDTVKKVPRRIHTNRSCVYSLIKAIWLNVLKLGSNKVWEKAPIRFAVNHEGMNLTEPNKISERIMERYLKMGG